MVEIEYHHFATPSESVDLVGVDSNSHQHHKKRQLDIIYILMGEKLFYEIFLPKKSNLNLIKLGPNW